MGNRFRLEKATHQYQTAILPNPFNSTQRRGISLPKALRLKLETFFNADFAQVRIYEGLEALALGAFAVAAGERLFFAPGCYRPQLASGQQLIAHELTHVLQQRLGRIPQTAKPYPYVLDDADLEAEAEQAARAFSLGQRWQGCAQINPGYQQQAPGSVVLQAAKVKLVNPAKTSFSLFKNDYEKFLADYTLIQNWMTKPSEFLPALAFLDKELKKSLQGTAKRLTSVLIRHETENKINENGAPMYTAVLNGPEFVAMGKKGVLPKDHVTPEHGEFTHRLHWYIVFYKATQGFTRPYTEVLYNAPAVLLKNAALKEYAPPEAGWPVLALGWNNKLDKEEKMYESKNYSMWEALFDRRPFDTIYDCSEDWLSCPEMFMALLLPSDQAGAIGAYTKFRKVPGNESKFYSMSTQFPELSYEVTRRYLKRAQELLDQGNKQSSWSEWYNKKKAGEYAKIGGEGVVEVLVPKTYQYWEYDSKTKGPQRSKAVLMPNKND
ncbi:MAG: LirA/MavJ family T4SS effector [Methylococcaceae bacterium]|jgi:hypothetical protein